MPYNESVYERMTDLDYYGGHMKGGSSPKGGHLKYDVGYGHGSKYDGKMGKGDSMYMQRGNDYSSIQDGIASKNKSKLKPQMYHNY